MLHVYHWSPKTKAWHHVATGASDRDCERAAVAHARKNPSGLIALVRCPYTLGLVHSWVAQPDAKVLGTWLAKALLSDEYEKRREGDRYVWRKRDVRQAELWERDPTPGFPVN